MGFVIDPINDVLGDPFGKDARDAASNSANQMSEIAQRLFGQTDPLRKGMISNWENMLGGNYDVSQSPMYGAAKYNLGTQFNTARDNIMGALPSGGGLQKAIADSYLQEAGGLANASGNIFQDEYNKAYGMATGAPQQAMSGLGGSGALNAQNYASKTGKTGDLGMGLGYFLGGK